MGKDLFIAEKPSVAREFAKALKYNMSNRDGYMESEQAIVTWCVGHLVTMSYPDAYDPELKRWTLKTLPFIPEEYKYEVIPGVQKQFDIVSGLLNRADVTRIYVCTDSGREGEYIYRLVERQAGVHGKERRRVWIDSQTEEEILRGIREAKDLSAYDSLCDAAYLRAKEDYLMGINFSRVLTLKYGTPVKNYLKRDKAVISVGRVMTCVLGMVVNREREIRQFVKTPFYRVTGRFSIACQAKDNQASASLAAAENGSRSFEGEWRAVEGSRWFQSPLLYKENGFKDKEEAQKLINFLEEEPREIPVVDKIERKKEQKNPPLLYNLAELQNDCSKYFKISPDETLRIVQELYEKKLTTYPRTDARVLSTAVAKEISKNISGLRGISSVAPFAAQILESKSYQGIAKTRYVNDKQITDHYAIIPTGQGMGALRSLSPLSAKVYEVIARRFLSIFYPPAIYQKYALELVIDKEHFFANFRVMLEAGYLKVADVPGSKKKSDAKPKDGQAENASGDSEEGNADSAQKNMDNPEFIAMLGTLKKGAVIPLKSLAIKEGETSPPKRYTSGSMILAMENAGQLIEDDELRAQIKGSGIGTSATRAEILKKLFNIKYLALNQKTQVITPTLLGEMIFDVVNASIRQLLNPELTASWEKGLTYVAEGSITSDEYMQKLENFVAGRTANVLRLNNQYGLRGAFDAAAANYKKTK